MPLQQVCFHTPDKRLSTSLTPRTARLQVGVQRVYQVLCIAAIASASFVAVRVNRVIAVALA